MNRSPAHSGNVPAYYVHSRHIGVSRTRSRRRDIDLAGYIEHVRGLQRQNNTAPKRRRLPIKAQPRVSRATASSAAPPQKLR